MHAEFVFRVFCSFFISLAYLSLPCTVRTLFVQNIRKSTDYPIEFNYISCEYSMCCKKCAHKNAVFRIVFACFDGFSDFFCFFFSQSTCLVLRTHDFLACIVTLLYDGVISRGVFSAGISIFVNFRPSYVNINGKFYYVSAGVRACLASSQLSSSGKYHNNRRQWNDKYDDQKKCSIGTKCKTYTGSK